MAYTVYEEDIIDDIISYLSTNLGTSLSGIETETADGVTLGNIKKYDIGDKDVFNLQSYPAGLMFPSEVSYEPSSLGCDILMTELILTIAVKGGKTDNLTTKVLRYAAAVRQCVDADRTAGGTIDRMAVSMVNFYARPPGIEDKMVIDIVINAEKEIPR